MPCFCYGATDGLALDDHGWRGGLQWRVSRGPDAICCLGPDDPWLKTLKRRVRGSLKIEPRCIETTGASSQLTPGGG